jgi:gliding motility-associated-like protein
MYPSIRNYFLIFLLLLTVSQRAQAQLIVSGTQTPAQLVQNVLIGSGVTVSNITFSGAASQRGSFNCVGACNIGIGSGVILNSGSNTAAIGPNNSTGAGMDTPAGSDPDLNALHPTGTNAQDAAVLEFDFCPALDSIKFRYVWGSEEYSDYVGSSCNDYFGFFISGRGITGKKNIAIVPNTSPVVPISINTVNNGNAGALTTPNGPCTNCAYFRDNHGSTTTQYDGLTTVLTAGHKVCPCEVYHMKLAVQDFCDGAFDSGVFLEAGSFSASGFNQIPIFAGTNPTPLTLGDTVFICPGDSVLLNLGLMQVCSADWNTGDTTVSIYASTPGYYFAQFTSLTPFCYASTPAVYVGYNTAAYTATPNGPTSFCPGDSVVLTASSGTGYLWSNGATTQSITVFNPGNYYCIVNYGGACSDTTNQVAVSYLSGSTLTITPSGSTNLCPGQSVTLTSSTPSVSWSTGATTQSITVNTAGAYSATPTAAGFCPNASSITVTQAVNPVANVTGVTSICQGNTTLLNAPSGLSGYQWSNGQTTASINVGTAGNYTVTVTNAAGCTASASATLTVNAAPVVAISGDVDFCLGASSNLSATAGYTNYQWSTGVNTSTANVSLPGTYTVTVTDANGCTNTASQTITVFNNPLPAITGVTAICQGANANLQAAPAGMNYLWSNGSTASTIQPSAAGIYTVTVTDANGCSGTASQNVTVNSNPTPAITGPASVCTGNSGTLDAGAGYSSYLWSNGATTSSISVNSTGNYSVTVTDATGCQGNTTTLFTVLPFTQPVISGPTGFCTGNNATLTLNTSYGSYQWSDGTNNATTTITTGGNYTVTVTAANGCTGTTNYNITQWANPIPVITGTTAVCNGNAANIQASPAGLNYQWSTGATTPGIQPSIAGTYAVTVTDPNGCTGTTSQQITINQNPTPAITGNFTVCDGTAGLLDAGNATGFTYSWSNGAITSAIQPTSAGVYTVIVTDNNGCTGTASQTLTVNNNPSPAISGNTSFCAGSSVVLTVNGTYAAYQWNNGSTQQQATINNGGNFSVQVTDNNGCTGTAQYAVTMHPLPQVSLPATVDLCTGNSTTLNPGTFVSYSWSDGTTGNTLNVTGTGSYAVTVTDVNGCTGTAGSTVTIHSNPDPVISGDTSICDGENTILSVIGNYSGYVWTSGSTSALLPVTTGGSYGVVVTNQYGCTGQASFTVTQYPRPQVQITGNLEICEGENTTLAAVSDPAVYTWSTGSSTSSISTTAGGTYTVIATNVYGCTKNATAVVTAHEKPDVSYNPVNMITCEELKFKFNNTSTHDPGSKFFWRFGDGGFSAERSPVHVYPAPGDYNTSLRITTPYGCTDSTSEIISIQLPALPKADYAQSARVVSVFNSEISFQNKSNNAVRYKWSFGDGSSSEEENPTHIFDQVGTLKIKLHAFNEVECRDEFETTLEVVPFFVPNAFTPNNDGKNDVFFDGVPYMNITSYDMKIFNRWGQLVYQTDSFLRPWDGSDAGGNPSPEGLYTYMIKIVSIKGKYYEYPGTFSLIR